MFGIGQQELIIVLVIVLIIFGPKNLPRLARSMGQAIRDFRSGIKSAEQDLEDDEPVETSAKIERKGANAAGSSSAEAELNQKKAHGGS